MSRPIWRTLASSFKNKRFTHSKTITVLGKSHPIDEWTNLPPNIADLTGRKLHHQENHPVGIVRNLIEKRLDGLGYTSYNQFTPVVSKFENFDQLGFPEDHPGRSKTDTYYLNKDTLLRTHTSAHESECFQTCKTPGYLISADVYRRDTIDRTHYPAFHQMEGARTFQRKDDGSHLAEIEREIAAIPSSGMIVEDPHPPFHDGNPRQLSMSERECELLGIHLKKTMELIMGDVFAKARAAATASGSISKDSDLNSPIKARWIEAYFPWTSPSWEIEIWWKGEWLEMCGCGVVQQQVLDNAGLKDRIGWAFGIGLERTAMILFGIPDIRLFWTHDQRFLSQFQAGKVTNFRPYSKYPSTSRDLAFWNAEKVEPVHINDIMEVVRDIGGDLVENVELIDEFVHPKSLRLSHCYRIRYQAMDRSLTNEEINVLQDKIVDVVRQQFSVEIR